MTLEEIQAKVDARNIAKKAEIMTLMNTNKTLPCVELNRVRYDGCPRVGDLRCVLQSWQLDELIDELIEDGKLEKFSHFDNFHNTALDYVRLVVEMAGN